MKPKILYFYANTPHQYAHEATPATAESYGDVMKEKLSSVAHQRLQRNIAVADIPDDYVLVPPTLEALKTVCASDGQDIRIALINSNVMQPDDFFALMRDLRRNYPEAMLVDVGLMTDDVGREQHSAAIRESGIVQCGNLSSYLYPMGGLSMWTEHNSRRDQDARAVVDELSRFLQDNILPTLVQSTSSRGRPSWGGRVDKPPAQGRQ